MQGIRSQKLANPTCVCVFIRLSVKELETERNRYTKREREIEQVNKRKGGGKRGRARERKVLSSQVCFERCAWIMFLKALKLTPVKRLMPTTRTTETS